MQPLHWALTIFAGLVLVVLAGLLVYDVWAMQKGERTLSAIWSKASRLWAFAAGLVIGFVLGVIAGHLFWPVAGVP